MESEKEIGFFYSFKVRGELCVWHRHTRALARSLDGGEREGGELFKGRRERAGIV